MSNRFLFLTNRKNLIGIMSSGLIGTKEIYAKYQVDILTKTKGFVPLFTSGVSGQLIELSTENKDTNFGVILEFKKEKLPSKFTYGLNSKGELLKEVGLDNQLILRLSSDVLSTNMIQEIHFQSDKHLRAFKALMFPNAPIDVFSLTVSPKIFNAKPPFPIEYFENIKDSKGGDKKRIARISDKVVGSIALLSESIGGESDFLLFNSLLTSSYPRKHLNIKDEYNTIVEAFDSIVAGVNLNKELSADFRLLHITLTELISLDRNSGWVVLDFLDKLQSNYQNSITNMDEGTAIWFESCRKYINREDDIDKRIFTDEKNMIQRAIFFFLLRPNYDDIIDKENSYLDPGHFVKTLAILIAGFRIGYARLGNQFKDFHHQIFAPLKADIINYELGKVSGGYEKKFISNVQAIVNIKTGTHVLEYKLLKEPIEAEIDKEIIAMEAEAQRINDQEIARKIAKDKAKVDKVTKEAEAQPIKEEKAKVDKVTKETEAQPIKEEKAKVEELKQKQKYKFDLAAINAKADQMHANKLVKDLNTISCTLLRAKEIVADANESILDNPNSPLLAVIEVAKEVFGADITDSDDKTIDYEDYNQDPDNYLE